MTDSVDVAVVGAGPYGLSVAAHLSAAGVNYRHFGVPMKLWREMMPKGMYLKSQGFASNLSDPRGEKTLEAFCTATGRPYKYYGLPVSLENFVAYGAWFQEQLKLPVEETLVTSISRDNGGFLLNVGGTEQLRARKVVLAIGVEHFAYTPAPFDTLPKELCGHASEYTDLGAFKDRKVVVVGAGNSALESAALLHEGGADVEILVRGTTVKWNGLPLAPDRPFLQRLREPEAGLGSGWSTWFYSNHPELFRRLPANTRIYRSRTALGPAGASWLRVRVEGQLPVQLGHKVTAAEVDGDQVKLTVDAAGTRKEIAADHIFCGTGYRWDVKKLSFLDADLKSAMRTVGGGALVGGDYESSVHGLYVVGPVVAPSMGPVMRFVFGSEHAATAVGRQLAGAAGRAAPAVAATR
jgi:thioredoxin reductase